MATDPTFYSNTEIEARLMTAVSKLKDIEKYLILIAPIMRIKLELFKEIKCHQIPLSYKP
jgi:hypothetical protein